jgi:hypothetical protein
MGHMLIWTFLVMLTWEIISYTNVHKSHCMYNVVLILHKN